MIIDCGCCNAEIDTTETGQFTGGKWRGQCSRCGYEMEVMGSWLI